MRASILSMTELYQWKFDCRVNNIGLVLALVSSIAALTPAAAFTIISAGAIAAILFVISLFVSYMNILVYELQAAENGCPSSLATLGNSLEIVSLISSFFGVVGIAFGAWLSFFVSGAIGGSVSACR